MRYKNISLLIIILLTTLMGCAGPVSPFGSVELWSGDGHELIITAKESSTPSLYLYPKRQVLHRPTDFKMAFNLNEFVLDIKKSQQIGPLIEPNLQIKITYNKKDVSKTFFKSTKAQKTPLNLQVQYIFNKLNLKPDRRHEIDIYWRADPNKNYEKMSYLPPVCMIKASRSIATTEPFSPKTEYINEIYKTAFSENLNPSLIAGLIAQESGFNPYEVSWAKAIGLTQVTTLADNEIRAFKPQWPRDPRITKLRVYELRRLIQNQQITMKNDWRLDPTKSILGGALYLNYLIDYWNLPDNQQLLKNNPNTNVSEVILASYNSGAARVKNKIRNDGSAWLDSYDLKEAFKYVNSVMSYCYHFSED